jgi:hypothetical protein
MAEGTGLIRRFYEDVIGQRRGFLAPPGREGIKFFVSAFHEAFPDIRPKTVGRPWLMATSKPRT